MHPDDGFQHLRDQHQRAMNAWFTREPHCQAMYAKACRVLKRKHYSFATDKHGRVRDVFWDCHDARHAFGVRDATAWFWLVVDLEGHGWASVWSYGGDDDGCFDKPLADWGERDISLYGVNWLLDKLGTRRAIAWCDECDDSA